MSAISGLLYPANIRFPMERANSIQILNTCSALAEKGIEVHLIVRKSSRLSDEEALDFYGLKAHHKLFIHRIPLLGQKWNSTVRNRLFSLCCAACIVWLRTFHGIKTVYLRDNGLAQLLIRLRPLFGFNIFFEIHNINHLLFQEYGKLYSNIPSKSEKEIEREKKRETYLYKKANGIVTITSNLKEHATVKMGIENTISVIPDGTKMIETSPRKRTSQKNRNIYYIGQLYPWKGVDILIQAMQYLDTVQLTVVGGLHFEEDRSRLKQLAKELKVLDRIEFPGFFQPRDIQSFLATADIGIIPLPGNPITSQFTSPLKLFEYMAAKVAVVASDVPSIREIIKNGENGILVEPDNPKALAQGIETLLKDSALMKRLVDKAYHDMKEYAWDKRAGKIIEFIQLKTTIGRR